MKKILLSLSLLISGVAIANKDLKSDFVVGSPEIQSVNALSFGPEGILFIGDSKSAKIFAFDTKDITNVEDGAEVNIKGFDKKIAAVLGTTVDQITIQDLAVNPISKTVYFAVHHSTGTPVIMKIVNDKIEPVSLKNISYSSSDLASVVEADAKDKRGRALRIWAISDLNYSNGQVMVTGLSNQEFGSTFRSLAFPFTDQESLSSLEIYHAAHGRYETNSPIKAFTNTNLNGKEYVVASYTCTPLVIFPASDLKPGKHVKGRTVAELGNRNTPLDMIVMKKEGKSYLLMANSSRAVMKIDLSDVSNFSGSLIEPVKNTSGTAGVEFHAMPFVNVLQLEKLGENKFLMLQRKADGNLTLWTANDRWL